jgi:hypothetical protein
MDWKRERDVLIAQTYAFVQSVSGKKEEAARPESRPLPPVTSPQPLLEVGAPRVEAAVPIQSVPTGSAPIELAPIQSSPIQSLPVEPVRAAEALRTAVLPVKDEIQARIASFRAHQDRFNRERAEYFNATLAKLRAKLQEAPPPRSGQIIAEREPLSGRSSPGPAANRSETPAGSRSSENGRGPS